MYAACASFVLSKEHAHCIGKCVVPLSLWSVAHAACHGNVIVNAESSGMTAARTLLQQTVCTRTQTQRHIHMHVRTRPQYSQRNRTSLHKLQTALAGELQ